MRKQLGTVLDNGSSFKITFPGCWCGIPDAFETDLISFFLFGSDLSSQEGDGVTLGLADGALLARASLSTGLQPHHCDFSEVGKWPRYILLDRKSISSFKILFYCC